MNIAYDSGLTCALSVTALDRSIVWYRDVLGFDLLYRSDQTGWCELSTSVPGVSIGLSEVQGLSGKGGATLTFGVRDMQAAKAALDAASVRQDGAIRIIPGLAKLLTFFDPDGNTLMFYEALVAVQSMPMRPGVMEPATI